MGHQESEQPMEGESVVTSPNDALHEALRYIEGAKGFAAIHCPHLLGDLLAIKMCVDRAIAAAPPSSDARAVALTEAAALCRARAENHIKRWENARCDEEMMQHAKSHAWSMKQCAIEIEELRDSSVQNATQRSPGDGGSTQPDTAKVAEDRPFDQPLPITVPEGWRLVPMEPTHDMITAWCGEYAWSVHDRSPAPDMRTLDARYANCYRAMLAAAPSPTEQEGKS